MIDDFLFIISVPSHFLFVTLMLLTIVLHVLYFQKRESYL